jgi:hypothetical protein
VADGRAVGKVVIDVAGTNGPVQNEPLADR